jgi:4-amino-4-deoxy-L-arabinose transferase-like glycosyltransferase
MMGWAPLGRGAWLTLLLITAVHALMAGQFQLSADEAHYALYGAHPDWSYYDHPPLVGWVQTPWVALGGADWLMRVVPVGLWLLTGWYVVQLSANWFGRAAGVAALALWSTSPMLHLLGLALVPDVLLLPLTLAVMHASWRLTHGPTHPTWRDWALLGISLGLAGLAKYTAVLLALGAAWVLWRRHGGRVLALPGLWLALLVAAAMVSPVFVWNAANEWASLAYQLNHAAGAKPWAVARVLVFVLAVALVFGPAIFWGAWDSRGQLNSSERPNWAWLGAFIWPGWLLWLLSSGRGSTLPHWPAPTVMAMLPVAAVGLVVLWQRRAWLVRALLGLQATLCLALAGLMLVGGWSSAPQRASGSPKVFNLFADLYGWQDAAQTAVALAQTHGAQGLGVLNWTLASRVAWYARPMPVQVLRGKPSQFDRWFGKPQRGDTRVVLNWSLKPYPLPVGPGAFAACAPLQTQTVQRAGQQLAAFEFFLCTNWQGPP